MSRLPRGAETPILTGMGRTQPNIAIDQARRPLYVGVDLGGQSVKLGLVDDLGQTLGRSQIPTDVDGGPDDGVRRIALAVTALIEDAGANGTEVAAVGLATPGTMDIPAGMLLEPVNFPSWRQYPIRDSLQRAVQMDVTYTNDATAAAYGEYWVGTGRQYNSLVLLTLGTGIGGGIILGDQPVDGEHSHGGECGHIIIDSHDDARLCGCGQRGHLEAYASATAVTKRLAEELSAHPDSSLHARKAAGDVLTPKVLAEEAERGDAWALQLIQETARYLGVGVVSLMHTLDPAAVVLGGAMTFGGAAHPLGQRFLAWVREEVQRRAFPVLAHSTVVDFASLGSHAGYVGAAGIARVARQRNTQP